MDVLLAIFGAFGLMFLIHSIFGNSAFSMIIILVIALIGCGYYFWDIFFNSGYYYDDSAKDDCSPDPIKVNPK